MSCPTNAALEVMLWLVKEAEAQGFITEVKYNSLNGFDIWIWPKGYGDWTSSCMVIPGEVCPYVSEFKWNVSKQISSKETRYILCEWKPGNGFYRVTPAHKVKKLVEIEEEVPEQKVKL